MIVSMLMISTFVLCLLIHQIAGKKSGRYKHSIFDPTQYDFSPDIYTEVLTELKYNKWYRQQRQDAPSIGSDKEMEEIRQDIQGILSRIGKKYELEDLLSENGYYIESGDYGRRLINMGNDFEFTDPEDYSDRKLGTSHGSYSNIINIDAVSTRRPTASPTQIPNTAKIPTVEYDALYSLYEATNGENWHWNWTGTIINRHDYYSEVPELYQNPYPGIPWNFTYENKSNPCVDKWEGVDCDCYALEECTVIAISLRRHNLSGTIPGNFFSLVNLTFLDLAVNNITGTLPVELYNNMSALSYLDLSTNKLRQPISPLIDQLTKLTVFNISTNPITGTIPPQIYNLTNLQDLVITFTYLKGSISEDIGRLSILEKFDAADCYLTGSIPHSLTNLTNLKQFLVRYNFLTSTIPESFVNFQHLVTFDVGHNQLTGPIPPFGQNGNRAMMRTLQLLHVDTNRLTGTIPNCIGNLSAITSFFAYANFLHGTTPSSLSQLSKMNSLNLQQNQLTGTIPESYVNLTSIWVLCIASNYFEGSPLPLVTEKPVLIALIMGGNQFTGTLPTFHSSRFDFPSFPLMTVYQGGYNYYTGTIPQSLKDTRLIILLTVDGNTITGKIPEWLGEYYFLNLFSCGHNVITGSIPQNITKRTNGTYEFVTEYNYLTGTIMESIGMHWTKLTEFNVQGNRFHGTIPETFRNLKDLQSLTLADNRFSGNLDVFLTSNHTTYENIDVSSNGFTGSLPGYIFAVPTLQTFVASSNCLEGTIPDQICQSQTLVSLILEGLSTADACQKHLFPGIKGFTSFTNAKAMDGSIPKCIFEMSSLISLHLSGNGLQGSIDDDISVSTSLEELSLAHNVLTGTIPLSLQERAWAQLDLSFNKFGGFVSNNISHYAAGSNSSLTLKVNRISGGIPHQIRSMSNIEILDGNLFECDIERTQLPPKDPDTPTYSCGSDAINFTIYAWIAMIFFVIVGVLCFGRHQLNLMEEEEKKDENGNRLTELTNIPKNSNNSHGNYSKGGNNSENAACDDCSEEDEDESDAVRDVSEYFRKSRVVGQRSVTRTTQSTIRPGTSSVNKSSSTKPKWTFGMFLSHSYKRLMEVIDYFFFIVSDSIGELTDISYQPCSQRTNRGDGDVDDYPLFSLHRVLDVIRTNVLYLTIITMLLLVPIYFTLSYFESTYELTYAWQLSAIFLSGKASGAMLGILFTFVIVWFFFSFMKRMLSVFLSTPGLESSASTVPTANSRQTSTATSNSANSGSESISSVAGNVLPISSAQKPPVESVNNVLNPVTIVDRLVSTMIGIFNFIIMVLIDIAYVVAILNEGGKTVLTVQILLSIFKLAWNETVLWRLYPILKRWAVKTFKPSLLHDKSSSESVARASHSSTFSVSDANRDVSTTAMTVIEDEEGDVNAAVYTFSRYEVSYLVFTVIMNNIIIPCISIAIVSSDCYYNAFFAEPPTEQTSVYNCQLYGTIGPKKWCMSTTVSTEDSSFNVPFIYRYQCSAAFITNFAPVHIFMFIIIGLVLPIIKLCLKAIYDHTAPVKQDTLNPVEPVATGSTTDSSGLSWKAWTREVVGSLLPKTLLDLQPKKPKHTKTYIILDKDRLVVKLSAYLGIILAFGTLFPPLTVIACISVFSMTYFEEVLLGRLLFMAKQEGYHWYRVHLERNCQGVVSAWHGVVWLLLPFAALSFSYVLFDTIGDKYGWRAAIGPALFLALLPLSIVLYRQLAVRLGLPMVVHATFEKDVKGKTFSEVYQDVRSVSMSLIGPSPMMVPSGSSPSTSGMSRKKYDFGVNASAALSVDEGQGIDVGTGRSYSSSSINIHYGVRPTVNIAGAVQSNSVRNPLVSSVG